MARQVDKYQLATAKVLRKHLREGIKNSKIFLRLAKDSLGTNVLTDPERVNIGRLVVDSQDLIESMEDSLIRLEAFINDLSDNEV